MYERKIVKNRIKREEIISSNLLDLLDEAGTNAVATATVARTIIALIILYEF